MLICLHWQGAIPERPAIVGSVFSPCFDCGPRGARSLPTRPVSTYFIAASIEFQAPSGASHPFPSPGCRGLIAIFPRPSIQQMPPHNINVRRQQASSQDLDLTFRNALKNLRQLPIRIQRAEHMMVRVLQHETITHRRRLCIHAADGL